MTTIDDRHRENSLQNDGDPVTTFTAGDMSRQRNAEPTAPHNVADTEGLRAAATRALRILERRGLGPITAARGLEMYLPLWLHLFRAAGSPHINIAVMKQAK